MGMIRRILNIGVGLAAGALAYKLLGDYNKNQMVEGALPQAKPCLWAGKRRCSAMKMAMWTRPPSQTPTIFRIGTIWAAADKASP